MKKRKILLLIPFAGLVLSGCTFQEGWQTATGWLNNNIWTPVKEFFEGLFGGGEKKKEEEEEEDDPTPTPTPTPTPSYPDPEGVEVIGSKEEPISVSEFRTLVDSYIPFDAIDSGKSSTDTDHWFFVEAKVKSSSAFNDYGEVEYLNIYDTEDKSLEVTGHFVLVDESLGDYSEANSLTGKTVVVKGCGCLYNHSTKGKTYQMAKFDNDHKPVVVKVTDPQPSGLDYGTLQNPLTVTQAAALIDAEDPTLQTTYVTGEVKSNTAWSTQYSNIDIVITDGQNDLKLFRAGTLPNSEQPAANALVGKVVVAHGTGMTYNSTYELDSGCVVDSIENAPAKTISEVVSVVGPSEVPLNSTIQPSQVTVTVNYQEGGSGTATVSSVVAATDVAGSGFTADVTIEGWNETLHFTYDVSSEEKNYGTAENPLTPTEACTLLDSENPALETMYVAGIVKANGAWNTQYSNVEITITDGTKDFKLYRATTLPDGVSGTSITANSLVGKMVVGSGTGKIYNGTYELDSGCSVLSIEDPVIASIVSVVGPEEVPLNGTVLTSQVTVNVIFEGGIPGTATVTNVVAATSAIGTGLTADVTIAGWNETLHFTYDVTSDAVVEYTQTLSYAGGTTANMTGEAANDTAAVGGSAPVSLYGTKVSGSVNVGLNKDGTIRLYKGGSTTLTIEVSGGTITSLDITTAGTVDGLTVNGTAVAATVAASTTYNVNVGAASAVLANPGSSAQTWISSIVVHYTLNA